MHPHLSLAAWLLTAVYALAIAVAVAHPGGATVAGLVVLVGLTARGFARHRRSVAVLAPDVAPATA